MTRFREQRRLEKAIENRHEEDLKWASEWCDLRLSTATMKHHQKHWMKLKKRVDAAIAELEK